MTRICRLCGRASDYHFCREPAPGASLSCKALRLKQTQGEKKLREKKLSADLNQGRDLGSSNKELADRLRPLVLRSYGEVAAQMGLSRQAVRLIERRALNKIRAALLPYKGAMNGDAKVRQITEPIATLER